MPRVLITERPGAASTRDDLRRFDLTAASLGVLVLALAGVAAEVAADLPRPVLVVLVLGVLPLLGVLVCVVGVLLPRGRARVTGGYAHPAPLGTIATAKARWLSGGLVALLLVLLDVLVAVAVGLPALLIY